ncbi:hypothetical protein M433DRAFT_8541 [Acidomyces richmondensis BFW]|nr:MAG: hypothetical protein FE78DRAFT_30929 [Acidomyces sp. 'richmondensis']KYG40716.1 hypothetical protein M433DRAFT_8541 [Acidomyces richmondensis BFW]
MARTPPQSPSGYEPGFCSNPYSISSLSSLTGLKSLPQQATASASVVICYSIFLAISFNEIVEESSNKIPKLRRKENYKL